ncbi:MAG: hypothetical protein HKN54_05430 [Flavobacteriaceae bacterium]|nr:hypothetical protein [Flavobacteriaceae bacterium]
MEALVLRKEIEPIHIRKKNPVNYKYEGILNSSYKLKARRNFFDSDPQSIYGIKQRVKSWQYGYTSEVDTLLKLSVFAIALIIALV